MWRSPAQLVQYARWQHTVRSCNKHKSQKRTEIPRACPEFFIGARPKGGRPRAGVFLGRGQQPPPHKLGGLGERSMSSPGGVRGGAPTAQRFSTIFRTQDGLSRHYISVSCGLSWSHWGKTPPPLAYAAVKHYVYNE